MTSSIYLLCYAGILVFFAAVARRVYRQLAMPEHLRWELYPVGHEPGARGKYGGSYLEELDWWTKPIHSSKIAEAGVMVPEIILIKGLWEHNRPLWYISFPFHFGLYLLMGTVALLTLGGAWQGFFGAAIAHDAGLVGAILYYATILTGYVGLTLGLIGAVALLIRRVTDQALKDYTALLDYLNLLLFIATLGAGLLAWLFVPDAFGLVRGFIANLLTFKVGAPVGSPLVSAAIVLAAVTMAYIPLTHMSHFFTKYFMYHHVRWNDAPNKPGGKLEQAIAANLERKPTWAAEHVGADGAKTWAQIATTNPAAEDK